MADAPFPSSCGKPRAISDRAAGVGLGTPILWRSLAAAALTLASTAGSSAELNYGAPPHSLRDPPECQHLLADSVPFPDWVECAARLLPRPTASNRHDFAELYDPSKWRECRLKSRPNEAQCEPYRLRRRPEPEYWPHPGTVPPIQWPAPPKESVYRWWMSARQYFDALCKSEAGEFVYRTVDNVEGIYQVRPRVIPTDNELQDRYVLNDPFGYVTGAFSGEPSRILVRPGRFSFVERIHAYPRIDAERSAPLVRIRGFARIPPDPYDVDHRVESIERVTARYGYTWRGIDRLNDRRMGIAGGELAVIDLSTNEILAIRRGFAMSGGASRAPTGIWWLGATLCPRGKGRDEFSEHRFVLEVLRPAPYPAVAVHDQR
jgi:hypothetical protein